MPQERAPMRKVREVLRLDGLGLNKTQIHRSTRLARSTVREYLERAQHAGVSSPAPDELDDVQLERLLFGEQEPAATGRVVPDFARVKREFSGKGVTLQLLHAEYEDEVGKGAAYSYSRFCELFREHEKVTRSPTMRQRHVAGERAFVDWAGMTMEIIDRPTGEVIDAQIFVGSMGASSFTHARAYRSQAQRDWQMAHVHLLEALGGVPRIVVPDNTKTGVTQPHHYDPDVNLAYADLARHYDVAVIPARVVKPQDKAKVENAVLQVERHVLAPLRKMTFFGIDELNQAMQPLIDALNDRTMRDYDATRRELFEQVDRPAMRPLPPERYQYAEWSRAKVGPDYHVKVDGHFYSVPYKLIGTRVEIRQSASAVEIFDQGARVSAHPRSFAAPGGFTTRASDMPDSHRRHAEWTPQRIERWAASEAGEHAARAVARIMNDKPHPEQGFRSALGVIRLGKRYGADRLERSCERALASGAVRYRSIENILKSGLDRQPLIDEACVIAMPRHPNIRGGSYFASPRTTTPTTKGPGC